MAYSELPRDPPSLLPGMMVPQPLMPGTAGSSPAPGLPPPEPLEPPEPPEPPELHNLADDLDEKELDSIAGDVISDYQMDVDSRTAWLAMHAHWIDVYYQQDKPANPPWVDSSAESMPLLAEACNQFHARALRALFPSRNIVKAVPGLLLTSELDPTGLLNKALRKRAERVGRHMSWQLMVKDKAYRRDKDSLLLSVAVHGSFFTKVYYDPIQRRNVVENVRAEDLVVNYGVGPRAIEAVERKTHVIHMSKNRTAILQAKGYFVAAGEPYVSGDKSKTGEASERAEGIAAPAQSDNLPCRILEQHRFLDLDEDGIAEPYIVWVDHQSRKVLRLTIRYEVDQTGAPANDKEPLEYFVHWMFLPNPDGFYGLGMGHLVGQINTSVNKLLRQTIDAGTLANAGNHSGYVSAQLGMPKGEQTISLGKLKVVEASADDITKGIYTFKFPGPSTALGNILMSLKEDGRRISSAVEALSGQTEKVMQPTTILALIDQATQMFSTVYERLGIAWQDELAKIYRLNRKYLEREAFVFDASAGVESDVVSGGDYADDLLLLPMADPKLSTDQQRLAKANAEWQFVMSNPLITQNPVAFHAASKRYLEALQVEGIDEILPPLEQTMAMMAMQAGGAGGQVGAVGVGEKRGNGAVPSGLGHQVPPGRPMDGGQRLGPDQSAQGPT